MMEGCCSNRKMDEDNEFAMATEKWTEMKVAKVTEMDGDGCYSNREMDGREERSRLLWQQ